ncbi:MAG: LysR family transcriptional regulator [Desulfarculaceae bacterium]|nr:LysR family transcriptional regulator [Desulfarculaceae bacterium]MCF8072860.1 LysR family transcriptional regulator [Desulfarculaceae bacterium]MCF8101028.1 LysR family transcriptional regulator [Desulfarculaceae bacterium]MCF8115585.1 LysR family transcriptional regulator [Desulfarculaceae bacterium]
MARVRFKLWVEERYRVLFGGGRMALLQAVLDSGSLAGAARQMSMSYRAAWGCLRASEKRLGFSLLERGPEGCRAMRLTAKAQRLMEQCQAREQDGQRLAERYQEQWKRELGALRG